MRFWHLAHLLDVGPILRDGVLRPTGYPDIAYCESLRMRGASGGRPEKPAEHLCNADNCEHWDTVEHNRRQVTWLYSKNPLVGWPGVWRTPLRGIRAVWFCLDLDLDGDAPTAYEWGTWARSEGAEPLWIDTHRRLWNSHGEWVTPDPIPRDRWVTVTDTTTGLPVPGWGRGRQ